MCYFVKDLDILIFIWGKHNVFNMIFGRKCDIFQHDSLKMHDVLSVMFLRKRGVLSMRFEANVMFSALYLGRET